MTTPPRVPLKYRALEPRRRRGRKPGKPRHPWDPPKDPNNPEAEWVPIDPTERRALLAAVRAGEPEAVERLRVEYRCHVYTAEEIHQENERRAKRKGRRGLDADRQAEHANTGGAQRIPDVT